MRYSRTSALAVFPNWRFATPWADGSWKFDGVSAACLHEEKYGAGRQVNGTPIGSRGLERKYKSVGLGLGGGPWIAGIAEPEASNTQLDRLESVV